jgi:hypothetical protein
VCVCVFLDRTDHSTLVGCAAHLACESANAKDAVVDLNQGIDDFTHGRVGCRFVPGPSVVRAPVRELV